jgi:hypothetical protein
VPTGVARPSDRPERGSRWPRTENGEGQCLVPDGLVEVRAQLHRGHAGVRLVREPTQVLRIELPEWRIVASIKWLEAEMAAAERGPALQCEMLAKVEGMARRKWGHTQIKPSGCLDLPQASRLPARVGPLDPTSDSLNLQRSASRPVTAAARRPRPSWVSSGGRRAHGQDDLDAPFFAMPAYPGGQPRAGDGRATAVARVAKAAAERIEAEERRQLQDRGLGPGRSRCLSARVHLRSSSARRCTLDGRVAARIHRERTRGGFRAESSDGPSMTASPAHVSCARPGVPPPQDLGLHR